MTTELQTVDEQLIDHIAERIEQRGARKLLFLLAANGLSVVVMAGSLIASYYSLSSRLDVQERRITINDRRIDTLQEVDMAQNAAIERKLEQIRRDIGEVNTYLRDHNSATLQQFQQRDKR